MVEEENMMTTERSIQTVSVHDRWSGKQANNLPVERLADAVRPWFRDSMTSGIDQAIESLREPDRRAAAADYLGLEILPAA